MKHKSKQSSASVKKPSDSAGYWLDKLIKKKSDGKHDQCEEEYTHKWH